MKPGCYSYLLIILFLFSKKNVAQEPRMDFNLVKKINGVTLGKITCIVQDRYGYMWFADQGNDCIRRFDGYKIKTFKYDPSDSNSLDSKGGRGGTIESIAADSSGCIWVGAASGIDKFDPSTNKFVHFRYSATELGGRQIYNILIDHLGIVWIGTSKGLDCLDQKTGKFTHFTHKDNDATSLSCDIVRCLYEDHEGVLWIGTGWEFVSDQKDGGLNRFNRQTRTFTRYLHNPNDPHSLAGNKVRAIFEDSHGVFWIGTDGDGLHIMDRKTRTFERLTYDPRHPEKLSRPPLATGKDWADHITFITEDGAGAIWIGTYYAGLVRYNPVNREITHYDTTDKSRSNGFTENNGWCAFTSRDGTLWISTESSENGVSNLFRVDPMQKAISVVDIGDEVTQVYQETSGIKWMGLANNGLLKMDPNTHEKKYFKHDPTDPNSISSNKIFLLVPDVDGFFWVGTWNGLNHFDTKTGRCTRYLYNVVSKGDYADTAVYQLLKGDNGEVYLTTNLGFYIMNSRSGLMTRYENNPADTASISANFTTGLCKDKSGNLWIGTWSNSGLNLLDAKTKKFKHYLVGNIIRSIYRDVSGKIWVGTNNGLYYRDDSTDSFIVLDEFGEDFRTAAIQVNLEDQDKNLWGSSSLGIFRLNAQRRELCFYGKRFGVNDNPHNSFRHSCKLVDGSLLFSKEGGYYSFLPRDLINSMPSQIILTDLNINGRSPNLKKGYPFKGPIEETKKIELAYNENSFSIDFAAVHYSSPEDNDLYYMLQGYDDGWLKVDSSKRAIYNKVPTGKYTFKIRASSSYGVWSEKEVKIVITPPWWLTWWFITSSIILLAATFYLLIRWWLNRKFQQQLEHKEKEKQLAELKQKATELEMQALRSQMNPHFIFNSLNSINMFILENNKLKASEYLAKFSKLIRLILQNSQEAFILLDRELEALQLYLELESLRFENKFEYRIAVEDNIDTTIVKVPPLIIQPYIENAIWHGLMHLPDRQAGKKEKGHLTVEVYTENETLFCKITDDGVGRKKAAELKSKSASVQKSLGMRITADRISMLQQKGQPGTGVTVKDIVSTDGSAGGTEVLLEIPTRQ